jgi:hypothetical protein
MEKDGDGRKLQDVYLPWREKIHSPEFVEWIARNLTTCKPRCQDLLKLVIAPNRC